MCYYNSVMVCTTSPCTHNWALSHHISWFQTSLSWHLIFYSMTFKVQKIRKIIPNDILSDLDSQLFLSQSLHWSQHVASDQIMGCDKVTNPPSEHTEESSTQNLPTICQKSIIFIVNLLISSDVSAFTAWNYLFLFQFILLHKKKIFIFLLWEHWFTVAMLPLSLNFYKLSRASSVGVLVKWILQSRNIFGASFALLLNY